MGAFIVYVNTRAACRMIGGAMSKTRDVAGPGDVGEAAVAGHAIERSRPLSNPRNPLPACQPSLRLPETAKAPGQSAREWYGQHH